MTASPNRKTCKAVKLEPLPNTDQGHVFVNEIKKRIMTKEPEAVKHFIEMEHQRQLNALSKKLLKGEATLKELDIQELYKLTGLEAREKILAGEITIHELILSFHNQKVDRQQEMKGNAAWHFVDEEHVFNMYAESDQLKGFVFSITDCIFVRDSPSTCGLLKNADRIPTEDCEMVKKLLKAGASITTKGTNPQFLFSMETHSNIFGTGLNPIDSTRTCGGSTGGDTALLKNGFVNAVIGTDVAGSLSIPALMCGVHSFKPSTGRLGIRSAYAPFNERPYGSDQYTIDSFRVKSPIQKLIKSVPGPIARSVVDLNAIMDLLCAPDPYHKDIETNPTPWKLNDVAPKRIGKLCSMSYFPVSDAAKSAMAAAETALTKRGYTVIDLTTDLDALFEKAYYLAMACYRTNEQFKAMMKGRVDIGEPLSPLFKSDRRATKYPRMIRMLNKLNRYPGRTKEMINYITSCEKIGVDELETRQMKLYEKLVNLYEDHELDAILSPGLPVVAPHHFQSGQVAWMCCYLYIYNLLMIPSGMVTMSKVREDQQHYKGSADETLNEELNDIMKGSAGLPVGVAISSLKFKDENVMRVMLDLEYSAAEKMNTASMIIQGSQPICTPLNLTLRKSMENSSSTCDSTSIAEKAPD